MGNYLPTILKVASTMPILAGLGMMAMGLGVVDMDPKLAAVAAVYADPLGLPLKPFIAAGGTVKVLSALHLWGLSSMPNRTLAFLGLAAPATLAIYGHAVNEGAAAGLPPAIYLVILGSYYYLSEVKATTKTSSSKKSN